jgi:hypothetical protein
MKVTFIKKDTKEHCLMCLAMVHMAETITSTLNAKAISEGTDVAKNTKLLPITGTNMSDIMKDIISKSVNCEEGFLLDMDDEKDTFKVI